MFTQRIVCLSTGHRENRQCDREPEYQRQSQHQRQPQRQCEPQRDVHVWGGNRVSAGRYAWPRGYAYGRRSVGYIVPRPLLGSAYYYSGWRALGLAAPLTDHQWIRYGDDLMLVQIGTGRVVDVRYGVFG